MSESRRQFIRIVALGAACAPIAALINPRDAHAADAPHVAESDPTASALGYHEDSTKVDAAKYPNHKPTQICGNCNLGQPAQADGYLPCAIFPGKSVNPKGWCAAYVQKG